MAILKPFSQIYLNCRNEFKAAVVEYETLEREVNISPEENIFRNLIQYEGFVREASSQV